MTSVGVPISYHRFFMVFHSYRPCPPANGCKVALQAFHIPLLYLDTAFILTAVSFFAMQMHNKMAMCRLWRHALELKRVAVPLHMRKTSSVAYFAYDCGASEAHEVLYFSITPRGCNFEGFQPFQTICKKWPVMPDKSTGFVLWWNYEKPYTCYNMTRRVISCICWQWGKWRA